MRGIFVPAYGGASHGLQRQERSACTVRAVVRRGRARVLLGGARPQHGDGHQHQHDRAEQEAEQLQVLALVCCACCACRTHARSLDAGAALPLSLRRSNQTRACW